MWLSLVQSIINEYAFFGIDNTIRLTTDKAVDRWCFKIIISEVTLLFMLSTVDSTLQISRAIIYMDITVFMLSTEESTHTGHTLSIII